MNNLNLIYTMLDFEHEIEADIFYSDERCVIEAYYKRTGTKAYTIRWAGPKALEQCQDFVAERVQD